MKYNTNNFAIGKGSNTVYYGMNKHEIFKEIICQAEAALRNPTKNEMIIIDTEGEISKNISAMLNKISNNSRELETFSSVVNVSSFITTFPYALNEYKNINWDDPTTLKYNLSDEQSGAITAVFEAASSNEANKYEYQALCRVYNDLFVDCIENKENKEKYITFSNADLLNTIEEDSTIESSRIAQRLKPFLTSYNDNAPLYGVNYVNDNGENDKLIHRALRCIDLSNIHEMNKAIAVQSVLTDVIFKTNLNILDGSGNRLNLFIPFESRLFKTNMQICNLLTLFKRIRQHGGSVSLYTSCFNDLFETSCGIEFMNYTDNFGISAPYFKDEKYESIINSN